MDRDIGTPDRPTPEQPRDISQTLTYQEAALSRERETLEWRGYRYQLSPSEMAALYEIGRFRMIDSDDLKKHQYSGSGSQMAEDLASLRGQGLVQQRTIWTNAQGEKLNIVVLTKTARELLKERAPADHKQALYSGFVKPAEVAHDAAIYRMFQAESARIQQAGGRVRRIVLDYELKQNVYRPLAQIRPHITPPKYAKRQAEVAAANGLKVIKGKIFLPDLRIEYEAQSGAQGFVDLELATEHYRSGMMRGKAEAGFKFYAPGGSAGRVAAAFDPEHIIEILSF